MCLVSIPLDNDVSNQQDATIFVYWSFIDLLEFALHVSADKLARLFHLNLVTGHQQYRDIVPKLYIQSKVLLKMGEFVAWNM